MSSELLSVLTYLERERGLNREVLITAVEDALRSASKKTFGIDEELRIEIDRKTCEIKSYAKMLVVDKKTVSRGEITLENARKIKPDVKVGETIEVEVKAKELGRIAAQTAKQIILQKLRQAERNMTYEEFKDRVGDIISGAVRQFNKNDIIVDLGRAEGIIPASERVPTEEYQIGDRIRAYVLKVSQEAGGPAVLLSRSHPDFIKRLFALEVSEIADGTVEIKGIAREAGYRTKIAVHSKDPKVDPVGACVGIRGIRVKNIVRELGNEKIDIIRWSDDIKTYVANALAPAKFNKIEIDQKNPRLVHVTVDADQLSLAIGKRGQNVRLTSKLLNMKIDIQKDDSSISFEEKVARAIESLASIKNISREEAEKLVKAGFLTVEGILAAEISEIQEMTGFDEETAKRIYETAASLQKEEGN